ncbi:MAG: UDP-N-acetylglucosamine 1-carboxyvinyltransferase [bacterium]|nr:UDP-N-acetylglucosamine 1-carboxyvinyltransferase [bacterium]
MERLVVTGGRPLKGSVRVKGAKNAFTKLMVAALLTEEKVILTNVPQTLELELTRELLQKIGARVSVRGDTVTVHAKKLTSFRVNKLSRKNRIPILAIAPLLHRMGKAEVPFVGGDKLGARPVSFHFSLLRKMGAEVWHGEKTYCASAKKLKGAIITLPYPSVGATETAILAAVLAKGKTTIKNAAEEPEIIDLISCLQKMGALIELGVNRVIKIEGVSKLHGAEHRVIPDRLEAAAFAVLALATNGNIFVEEAEQKNLITFLNAVRRIGGEYKVEKNGIRFFRSGPLKAYDIETAPHPGFMTDWQQPFTVLLMLARGTSYVHDTVYEDRFGYVRDFINLGAKIKVLTKCVGSKCRFSGKGYPHSIEIKGPARLKGAVMIMPDIRAGLAHLVAALAANGVSRISGVEHLDRGYERLDVRLKKLGARIERV